MPKLLIDTSIPHIEKYFSKHFEITPYSNVEELKKNLPGQDVLVCRSYTKITPDLLEDASLSLIATASSGSDHIQLPNPNIPILSAKGANAWAVSDYILSVLATLKVSHQKTIGIIGYGHIGKLLSQRLMALGYTVKVNDPFVNIPSSLEANKKDIFHCPVILLHCNYHQNSPYSTHHLIDEAGFKEFNSETILVNAARGSIVDEKALLKSKWQGTYCADVYENEPLISSEIIERASICTPHIAGHTLEGKMRITEMIAHQVHDFFKLKSFEHHNTSRKSISYQNWQASILEHFAPIIETQKLKANPSAELFSQLRTQHARHEIDIIF